LLLSNWLCLVAEVLCSRWNKHLCFWVCLGFEVFCFIQVQYFVVIYKYKGGMLHKFDYAWY
jgi:hypothetical protein